MTGGLFTIPFLLHIEENCVSVITNACLSQLMKHPKFVAAERISIYLNTSDEVATAHILEECWKNGKTLFIPKYE